MTFAEVELVRDTYTRAGLGHHPLASPAAAEVIDPASEEARSRFNDMRHVAQQGVWYRMDKTEVFYRQAKMMADFEDDYEGSVPPSCYYPRYQKLSYEQLRVYFTWRTKVRRGLIADSSASYTFLYLYELINNVGVADPEEGLGRLMSTWEALRSTQPVLDRYVVPWLKDYHVYYELSRPFESFAREHGLEHHYPTVFLYEAGEEDCFDLFADVSSYDINNSLFCTDGNESLVRNCFAHVLMRLRERFAEKGRCFEDSVFLVKKRASRWTPFEKALFFPVRDQADRSVSLSKGETYRCIGNQWSGKTATLSAHGTQLIGYIMKSVEAHLRKTERFTYRLSANLDSFKAIDRGALDVLGLSIPHIIEEACEEFTKLRAWRTVSVDPARLRRIRNDAVSTQEKLLVPEDEAPSVVASIEPVRAERIEAPEPLADTSCKRDDCWTSFASQLTAIEHDALILALGGGDIERFALEHNVMLEVLVEGINEKALDATGDTIFESDETVTVYQDYIDDLTKAVSA